MPPRGSGTGVKNAQAWQKAAISYLIDTMGERGLVACLPRIAGNGRTDHGDIDPKIGAELEAGLLEAVKYDISALDETQLRERLFFGAAIPSVRALNRRPKPEDTITRGGMHGGHGHGGRAAPLVGLCVVHGLGPRVAVRKRGEE